MMSIETSTMPRDKSKPAFFRAALDASPVPTIILERRANELLVRYVNRSFERRIGYPAASIVDNDVRMLCGADGEIADLPDPDQDSGDAIELVFRGVRGDGSEFWSELMLAPLGEDGDASRYVGLLRDVTAERAERVQLKQLALLDELTGLPNRRALEQRLARSIDLARAEHRAFPVLLLDLDGFKQVNDSLGHEAGDRVLRVIGARLRHELRADDTVARIGGDEFVLVLDSIREASQLADIRERLAAAVTAPIDIDGVTIDVGCSIGASWFSRDGADARLLLRDADRRMYEEKRRHHRDRNRFFDRALPSGLSIQPAFS